MTLYADTELDVFLTMSVPIEPSVTVSGEFVTESDGAAGLLIVILAPTAVEASPLIGNEVAETAVELGVNIN